MFAVKKKYFLIIENIKDIDLKNIKKPNKFIIIYRNNEKKNNIVNLIEFRKKCKQKLIKFYVANDQHLAVKLNSDGIYLSAFNKSFKPLHLKRSNYQMIGSAHNLKEIKHKVKQGCKIILFSRLFKVNYKKNLGFLGINKFNYYTFLYKNLIPLGGINYENLNKIKSINSEYFAILSEVKKKPAKIFSRLF